MLINQLINSETIDFVVNWAQQCSVQPQKPFWDRFVFDGGASFMSLMTFPTYNVQNTGRVMRFTYGHFPVFCTNTEGELKLTDKGFYRTFSPNTFFCSKPYALSNPYVHIARYNPATRLTTINPAYLVEYKKMIGAKNRIAKRDLSSKNLKSLTKEEYGQLIALNAQKVQPASDKDDKLVTLFYDRYSEINKQSKVERISDNSPFWRLTLPSAREIICYGIAAQTNETPSKNIVFLMELIEGW